MWVYKLQAKASKSCNLPSGYVCFSSRVVCLLHYRGSGTVIACVFVDRGRSDILTRRMAHSTNAHTPYVAALKNSKVHLAAHTCFKVITLYKCCSKMTQMLQHCKELFWKKENRTPGLQKAKNNYWITRIQ